MVNCVHGQHIRCLYLKYLDVAIVGVVALALAQGGGGVGVMRPGPDGAEPGREQADLHVRQLDRQVQHSLQQDVGAAEDPLEHAVSFDHANHLLYTNAEVIDNDVEFNLPLLEQPVRGLLVLAQKMVVALESPIA